MSANRAAEASEGLGAASTATTDTKEPHTAGDALAFVREGYDRWASVYDDDGNPVPPLEEPWVRAAAGDVSGRDVLDLGCGTGRHTLWLAAGGARVTAGDFSPGMLAQARALAACCPRAEKYVGWPMLVVLRMRAGASP